MPQTNSQVAIPEMDCNDKKKRTKKVKKCRSQKKKHDNFVPKTCTVFAQALQQEDWEKEIEERVEEEKKNSNPYDAEDAMNIIACNMGMYNMTKDPSPKQLYYCPSVHHKHPVRGINHFNTVVQDQFADAEE